VLEFTIHNEQVSYPEGTTYLQIAKDYQKHYAHDIVLVKSDYKLVELMRTPKEGAKLEFVTTEDKDGMKAYERSVLLLMLKAIYHIAGRDLVDNVWVRFSVTNGIYIELTGAVELNQNLVDEIQSYMKDMVTKAVPIEKKTVATAEAARIFQKHKMHDKERVLSYRRSSSTNIYQIGEFQDYFYGYMVPDTSYLKYFDLCLYEDGLVLQLPTTAAPEHLAALVQDTKVFRAQKESIIWRQMMGVNTVGDLNDVISRGDMNELILVQEALQEKRLAQIAEQIQQRKECKFVMIAGPSSSGKTTTSHRLAIQLRANGMIPHPISVDNYFVDREHTPIDENGEYDFERLECIDLELFNSDMTRLLAGEKVELPRFNFQEGRKEYCGDFLQLGKHDILIIEGIHALNDKMSVKLPKDSKFKIYLSALTQLCVDEHNRISTKDGRLIRRIVRDARTRGADAQSTIKRWPSVGRGEEANIFPYQEEADVVFNSSLIYELAVLKTYAEPLLFHVPQDCPEAIEAKRLLKFLDYFLGVGTEAIPHNSIVREFVGGSCFNV
jgi:uridine kinase